MERIRVVVTGVGAITPIGLTARDSWRSMLRGTSGVAAMTLCDPKDFPCRIAGEVKKFDPLDFIAVKESRRMARFSQFAVSAAAMAIEDADLTIDSGKSFRSGVLLGNGNGGYPTIEQGCRTLFERGGMKVSPLHFPLTLPNMAAANISRLFGLKGYNSTVVTACAASNQAMGDAMEVIRRGVADIMITGGTEAGISQLGLAGFSTMRALSTQNDQPSKASRPFDAERDGFVPGEGSAIIVIENLNHALNRGARILCELVGFGSSSDAYHLVQPEESGVGASEAMKLALNDARVSLEEVDYINAHGTSTPLNDVAETEAIKKVFGALSYQIPISSTKSMVGHALGGAGALDAIPCIYSITDGWLHPTINYEHYDPKCDLDYIPNNARQKDVRVSMSNAFGFGGQNACLVFKRYEE